MARSSATMIRPPAAAAGRWSTPRAVSRGWEDFPPPSLDFDGRGDALAVWQGENVNAFQEGPLRLGVRRAGRTRWHRRAAGFSPTYSVLYGRDRRAQAWAPYTKSGRHPVTVAYGRADRPGLGRPHVVVRERCDVLYPPDMVPGPRGDLAILYTCRDGRRRLLLRRPGHRFGRPHTLPAGVGQMAQVVPAHGRPGPVRPVGRCLRFCEIQLGVADRGQAFLTWVAHEDLTTGTRFVLGAA